MAISDNVSAFEALDAGQLAVSADGVVTGTIIDTANSDNGNCFVGKTVSYVDGEYALSIEQSNDPTFATGVTTVPDAQIIGSAPTIQADTVVGPLPKIGCFGNDRYIRLSATATAVTNGSGLSVTAILDREIQPAD